MKNIKGLDPSKSIGQYILRSWSTEEGLSTESTNDLLQTDDGYLWIGTYTGLHRFDGNEFTLFNAENSLLPSPNVLKLGEDSKGQLWIGTLHGIACYKDGKIYIPKGFKQLADYSIETLLITSDDQLWISTKSNQLFHYNKDSLIERTREFGLTNSVVLSLEEGINGKIFIGTDNSRLLIYDGQNLVEKQFQEQINAINRLKSYRNDLWIATGNGLYKYSEDRIEKASFMGNTMINIVEKAGDDILWLGTLKGIYRYNEQSGRLDSLKEETGLPNNIIRDIEFDRQGNIWGGTYRDGFFYLSDGFITSYTKNDNLSSNIITAATQTPEGHILLGDESGKLNLYENGKIQNSYKSIQLPTARLKHLFTDSKNRIWASTYAGLFRIENGAKYKYGIETGFPDNYIRQVFEDREGNIWVGTKTAGLIKMKGLNEWDVINTEKGMTSNYIMSINQNEKGNLYVGTISGLNIISNDSVVKQITLKDGLPSNFSFDNEPTDDYLWIASNDGLVGYSEEKTVTYTMENGLPFNIVYDILKDKKRNLWIPGEKGILRIHLDSLEKAARLGKNISPELFNKTHGMKNNHCLGGVHSFSDPMGNFWIPTLGGIVLIDNTNIKTKEPDINLIVENVKADNKELELINKEKILVPANTNRLEIEFTGIDYQYSDKINFEYKLTPFDREWITSSSERIALYTNLPYGTYTFTIKAGLENSGREFAKTIEIEITAAWWQTVWAKILMVVFIISAGYLIYWGRINALKAQNRRLDKVVVARTTELEKQKQELTAALDNLSKAQQQVVLSEKMASLGVLAAGVAHEINNPLNFIKGGLTGLKRHYEYQDKDSKIDDLLEAIDEGVKRASVIVSSLNNFSHQGKGKDDNCQINSIIENCLVMLQYRTKGELEIKKRFENEKLTVIGNNGRLHQVFLNLLTNSIQAIDRNGLIEIHTYKRDNKANIEISDNGNGISEEQINKITELFYTTKAPGQGTGLGLSIVYSIIKEHHGDLQFFKNNPLGTRVLISLPLSST